MGEPTLVSSGPGAARRGSGSGVRGRAGAASFRGEAGIDRGGGRPRRPGAQLHWNAPGTVYEVLECAAPGDRAGGQGAAIAHGPGADVG